MNWRKLFLYGGLITITAVCSMWLHSKWLRIQAIGALKSTFSDVGVLQSTLAAYKSANAQYPTTLGQMLDANDEYLEKSHWARIQECRTIRYLPIQHNGAIESYVLIIEAAPSRNNSTFVVIGSNPVPSSDWDKLFHSYYVGGDELHF